MKVEALENVKDQIGFCGIWFGSCVAGNGALRARYVRNEKAESSEEFVWNRIPRKE